MFQIRTTTRVTPQKNRTNKFKYKGSTTPKHLNGWFTIVSVGQGCLTLALMSRLFTWAKRVIYYPNTTSRFWVNLQINKVITRKAANTRMGKGKGGRVAMLGFVTSGTVLLALSKIRQGKQKRLTRQIKVKIPFSVTARINNISLSKFYYRSKIKQRYYVFTKKWEYFTIFKQTQQRELLALYTSIFRWYIRRPVLRKCLYAANQNYAINSNDVSPYGELPVSYPLYTALWSFSQDGDVNELPVYHYWGVLSLQPYDVFEEVFPYTNTPIKIKQNIVECTDIILTNVKHQTSTLTSLPILAAHFAAILPFVKHHSPVYTQWLIMQQIHQLFWQSLIVLHKSNAILHNLTLYAICTFV